MSELATFLIDSLLSDLLRDLILTSSGSSEGFFETIHSDRCSDLIMYVAIKVSITAFGRYLYSSTYTMIFTNIIPVSKVNLKMYV